MQPDEYHDESCCMAVAGAKKPHPECPGVDALRIVHLDILSSESKAAAEPPLSEIEEYVYWHGDDE